MTPETLSVLQGKRETIMFLLSELERCECLDEAKGQLERHLARVGGAIRAATLRLEPIKVYPDSLSP